MSFSSPFMLFLLVVPAALAAWVWRRSGRQVVLPLDHGIQTDGQRWRVFVNAADTLPAMLLAVAIFLLAGPSRLGEPSAQRVLTNIEFCIDVSGSMNARFGDGTRYDASMKAINGFLDDREGDAFGLTFFGNEVLHWVPLTTDTSAFRCAPPFMNPRNPGHPNWLGGTSIGKALMACRSQLAQREEGDRLILLVSDGFSSDLGGGKDEEYARLLNDFGITVFAIHVGGSAVPDPIVNIAGLTGGAVFDSQEPETLDEVFRRIDTMQQTRMEKKAAESVDNFAPYCVAGLSLVGMTLTCLFGARYTPW